jgi:hypothetical protein
MSIAHSIMLLMTLLFVLTTRGVRLDFHTAVRSGVRADLSPPASSPSLKRVHSMLQWQERSEVNKPSDSNGQSLTGNGLLNFESRSESVHSAPASPAGGLRTWNSPASSSLHRYATLRPPNTLAEFLVDTVESETLSDNESQDMFRSSGMEEEIECQDYPTPSSVQEDF